MLRVLYPRRYLSLCNFKYTNNKKGRFLWKNIKKQEAKQSQMFYKYMHFIFYKNPLCATPRTAHFARLLQNKLASVFFSFYKVIFLKTHRFSLDASGCSRKPCVPSRVLYRSINIFYSAAFSDVSFIYFFA